MTIGTPFDATSELCRLCGGCIYVCPACELRCTYSDPDQVVCGGCANLAPPCVDKPRFDDLQTAAARPPLPAGCLLCAAKGRRRTAFPVHRDRGDA